VIGYKVFQGLDLVNYHPHLEFLKLYLKLKMLPNYFKKIKSTYSPSSSVIFFVTPAVTAKKTKFFMIPASNDVELDQICRKPATKRNLRQMMWSTTYLYTPGQTLHDLET
jgi:hypothetical protein